MVLVEVRHHWTDGGDTPALLRWLASRSPRPAS